MHAVILVVLKMFCLFLFVEVKALLGLCYMLFNIGHKIKFLCLCLRQLGPYIYYNEKHTTRAKIICACASMILSVCQYIISMYNAHAYFYKHGYLYTLMYSSIGLSISVCACMFLLVSLFMRAFDVCFY